MRTAGISQARSPFLSKSGFEKRIARKAESLSFLTFAEEDVEDVFIDLSANDTIVLSPKRSTSQEMLLFSSGLFCRMNLATSPLMIP